MCADAIFATVVVAFFVDVTAVAAPVATTTYVVNVVVAAFVAAAAADVDAPIVSVCMYVRAKAPWDQLNSKARQF
jgi:hypothetical protein